ncbi:glycosyltransferase [Synoicihabitans lomoniglobus]|uniref:Glycosyltransferase n=1 Tax=Synoicihabitans lomoniglobus TaxID=2909285 RepID=A0AAF0CS21_9BACT|nr:glycosyltransferase [Opitutaceae bacterium LMO-M01]WED67000.1 glycosyltransferase [Opitutaceae bacterium LMO-M01]
MLFLVTGQQLRFARRKTAEVTVIMVLCGRAHLSLTALKALAADDSIPLRIILVDNGGGWPTRWLLSRLFGARIVRNRTNRGFGPAVNQALAWVDTPGTVLLNNDAMVRPGCLRALAETLFASPDVGAVGGKVVLLHGRVQEAGCILWADGHCTGYGRDKSEEAGEVNFRRDVDFCSGVLLALRTRTFRELGGMDENYAPAYAEDVDLCVRLWARGCRIVYEPSAVVDHYEFGTSVSQDRAFALQRRNHRILVAKHTRFLSHQPAPGSSEPRARQRLRPGGRRILFLDDELPRRIRGAGHPRMIRIMEAMVHAGHAISFYPLHRRTSAWEARASDLPPEVEYLGGGSMESECNVMDRELELALIWILDRCYRDFDAIWVSRPQNLETLLTIRDLQPELLDELELIYDAEAIAALRAERYAKLIEPTMSPAANTWTLTRELDLAQKADRVVAVSAGEAEVFRSHGVETVAVLGHAIRAFRGALRFSSRYHILFVGPLVVGSPNAEGFTWFLNHVLPLLRDRIDRARLHLKVVGRVDGTCRTRWLRHAPEVEFMGEVEDLTSIYGSARVFIAPIRYASGISQKVMEAAAYGVPVVTTPLVADLIGWRENGTVQAAATAHDFAHHIVNLFTDEAAWSRAQEHGLRAVERDCHPQGFAQALNEILQPMKTSRGSEPEAVSSGLTRLRR